MTQAAAAPQYLGPRKAANSHEAACGKIANFQIGQIRHLSQLTTGSYACRFKTGNQCSEIYILYAVSDGLNAQIWDVIVDPEYQVNLICLCFIDYLMHLKSSVTTRKCFMQGLGLGKKIVSHVVSALHKDGIDSITVFAEKKGNILALNYRSLYVVRLFTACIGLFMNF